MIDPHGRPRRPPPIDLDAGTTEHYADPVLYDFEYRRRRADVSYYRGLAAGLRASHVLELGCGTGRVLAPLARDGHRVIGVDRSRAMLERARLRVRLLPRAARARAALLQADLRAFALRRAFPLILSPFNVVQHLYERWEIEAFLACVRAHMGRGSVFAFDVLNPDLEWLTRDPERRYARTVFRHPSTGRRVEYTTNQVYDPVRQVALMRIYYRDLESGRERVVRLAHRYFFPEELLALVDAAGFAVRARFGGFRGERFRGASESQVLECVRR